MMPARRRRGRLGRGPAREKDMDVDEGDDQDDQEVSMIDVRARVLAKKFTEEQLRQTIQEYESLDILMRTANGQKLKIIN